MKEVFSQIKEVINKVEKNNLNIEEGLGLISNYLLAKQIENITLDLSRYYRKDIPEVIFCENKKVDEIVEIVDYLKKCKQNFFGTRCSKEKAEKIKEVFPEIQYNQVAKTLYLEVRPLSLCGLVAVITAGTSDVEVAEEVIETLKVTGSNFKKFYDVGVAGIHRVLNIIEELRKANVIVVVAGMDGALFSVVTGLVNIPVIGVPTSIGYGVTFSGITPLFTMLNSCAPGGAVVNINNGFGAGYLASLINRRIEKK